MAKKGILLVNLGTPDSPETKDVRKYLAEFLMDPRVIDVNPVLRTFLVKGIIVPFRSPKSAKLYKEIWDDKTGSPLLHYSILQHKLLADRLGDEYQVELAMRYQSPSIESALDKLKASLVESIQVIALFPQYASASTGSVYEKVMNIVGKWQTIPSISFINSFHDNELMIETFADNGRQYQPETYDHILFSFHGLPQRQLIKCDHTDNFCLKVDGCCNTLNDTNKFCYSAQSHHTAKLIAEKLNIPKEKYTICFQSRLGSDPWVQPYTSEIVAKLAKEGKKRLLVFCPAFVADCLETVYEVTEEYGGEFKALGGEHVQLVESLNDSPKWIDALEEMVKGQKF
ncbi:ferrochelatase [Mucilaginibacter frigoritolerans]|jgi:protoporphyrin/coproporphyrin ferrochelatase|uniref:Ferrochelatase n=1 Tax=Mucilaginibacter frigoritolerans TaxID=652788 RepID=A0A562U0X4_9SPHI|nr:ferrochelatase [Mucilaginibacter frigoritolerans]TWI99363.1 ferrochelatase [Mucilaginibacter frigoritolerans]